MKGILLILSVMLISNLALAEPLSLASQVEVATAQYTLLDLMDGPVEDELEAKLSDMVLGNAPGPGQTHFYSRGYLIYLLRACGFNTQAMDIPERVEVSSHLQKITPEKLQDRILAMMAGNTPSWIISFNNKVPEVWVPPGEFSLDLQQPENLRIPGNNILIINVWSGEIMWQTLRLSVFLDREVEAYKVKKEISRGAALSLTSLEKVAKLESSLPHNYVPGELQPENVKVLRDLKEGTIISWYHLEEISLISRGDQVTVRIAANNLVIDVTGTALEKGGYGDEIRVKSKHNGEILTALVVDRGLVYIDLRDKGE